LPALVIDRRSRREDRSEACRFRPQTEVEIFKAEEVVLIEQSHRVEDIPLHEHQAATHAVDDASDDRHPGADARPGADVTHAAGGAPV
jgi:hypothetical protein